MEKLVQGVQDKTEQLEHLKEENGQLFLSLTEQVESWKKIIFFDLCEKIYALFFIVYVGITGSGKGLRGSHLKWGISQLFSEANKRRFAFPSLAH